MDLPGENVWKLLMVQKAAAWMLTGVGHRNRVTQVLVQLQWLPISFWAQLKLLVLIFKDLHCLRPAYFNYHPIQMLRSFSEALF